MEAVLQSTHQCEAGLHGEEAKLQSAVCFWRESTFSHRQVGLHLVHVLLEAGQQFIGSSQRFISSQTLVIVSIRSELEGATVREVLCFILIGPDQQQDSCLQLRQSW